MNTTVIIAEVLLIGFFAFIWLFLLIIRVSILNVWDVYNFLSTYSSWAATLTLFSIALFYQLGVLMHWLSGLLLKKTIGKKYLRLFFEKEGLNYNYIRSLIDQKGSPAIQKILSDDRSIIRLARAGVLNFLFTAIMLFTFHQMIIGVIILSFSILCFLQWRTKNIRYYKRILDIYKIVT